MNTNNPYKQPDFDQWMTSVLKQAHDLGFNEGFEKGFEKGAIYGIALTMEKRKSAISDGLRHGSPECGKAMSEMRQQKSND